MIPSSSIAFSEDGTQAWALLTDLMSDVLSFVADPLNGNRWRVTGYICLSLFFARLALWHTLNGKENQ